MSICDDAVNDTTAAGKFLTHFKKYENLDKYLKQRWLKIKIQNHFPHNI